MYRSYGTQKKSVRFFGGLKSAATILTEPTALLAPENLWVMDRVLNLRQVSLPTIQFSKKIKDERHK